MSANRVSQYRGEISLAMIADGMNAARANASRLLEDARILQDAGRAHSAVALAILSIEESGKLSILRQMVLCENEAEWRQAWKDYRSHTRKNITWILAQLAANGAKTLEALRPIVDPNSDHPQVLDQLKQLCLYTDCVGSSKWTSPPSVNVAELTPYLLLMAKAVIAKAEVTEKELQLWRHHLLPTKHATFEENKRAISNWYSDMRLNGLSQVTEEQAEAFLQSSQVH